LQYVQYSTLINKVDNFKNCLFESLRVSTNGGAVYLGNVYPSFNNCTFFNNSVVTGRGNDIYYSGTNAQNVNAEVVKNCCSTSIINVRNLLVVYSTQKDDLLPTCAEFDCEDVTPTHTTYMPCGPRCALGILFPTLLFFCVLFYFFFFEYSFMYILFVLTIVHLLLSRC
jgi:hypothetical protein